MKKIILIILYLFLPVLIYASTDCLRCHPGVKEELKLGRIHTPLKQKGCLVCHNAHASNEPNLLTKSVKELCFDCHKEVKTNYTHLPVVQGECNKCHNAHASPYKALLKKQEAEVCFSCHEKKKILSGKNLHSPAKKDCLTCHQAHGGKFQWLLNIKPEKLCFNCHSKTKMTTAHNISNTRSFNTQICLSCHNAHASSKKGLLRQSAHKPYAKKQCNECHLLQGKKIKDIKIKGRSLCLKCHSLKNDETALYTHLYLGYGENVCLNCHSPHLFDEKPALKAPVSRICFTCHQDAKDKLLSNVYYYKHPEAKKGNCLNCHAAHSSNEPFFFKEEVVKVCVNCHKRQAQFTHPLGEKAIDPRCKKGMDCVSCHNPMGTKYKFNMIFDHRKQLCIQCHKIET